MTKTRCDYCGKRITKKQLKKSVNLYGGGTKIPVEYDFHGECWKVVKQELRKLFK